MNRHRSNRRNKALIRANLTSALLIAMFAAPVVVHAQSTVQGQADTQYYGYGGCGYSGNTCVGNSYANGYDNTAIGDNAHAYGTGATAIGADAYAGTLPNGSSSSSGFNPPRVPSPNAFSISAVGGAITSFALRRRSSAPRWLG